MLIKFVYPTIYSVMLFFTIKDIIKNLKIIKTGDKLDKFFYSVALIINILIVYYILLGYIYNGYLTLLDWGVL